MNLENRGEGGFIFVSHSHRDIVFVRKLRNELEKAGFEPLCFYLKCMDKCMEDAALKAELESLLLREISAREWFLYVNSEHSRKSEWVEFERRCVEKIGKRKILQIDVAAKEAVNRAVEVVLRHLRVFMSYSHRDEAVARQIKKKLVDNDYYVFFDEDLLPGAIWKDTTQKQIFEASKDGFVMVLLSEASTKSAYMMREVEMALRSDGQIAVVCLGDVSLPEEWKSLLADNPIFHLPSIPSDTEIQNMIEAIGDMLIEKMQLQVQIGD